MISYISGKIIGKDENCIVLENSGIGFKIYTTPRLLQTEVGSTLSVHTYMAVREYAINLYGFESSADLAFFELLLTVSGIGPKAALTILSAENTTMIKESITNKDAAMLARAAGVGKKTADKIIVELKDKLGLEAFQDLASNGQAASQAHSGDIFAALENLGYTSREIKEIITRIDASLPQQERLRQALKLLAK